MPLANKEIIHADIRPGWETTYNILCHEGEGNIELRLIDYESLHMASYYVKNDQTIFSKGLGRKMSSHEYVWWLVLWIAYNWQPPSEAPKPYESEAPIPNEPEAGQKRPHSSTNSNKHNLETPQQFVKKLFIRDTYESFTNIIGG